MRHLANTYHLSKEAYLRKTPKNGKSRVEGQDYDRVRTRVLAHLSIDMTELREFLQDVSWHFSYASIVGLRRDVTRALRQLKLPHDEDAVARFREILGRYATTDTGEMPILALIHDLWTTSRFRDACEQRFPTIDFDVDQSQRANTVKMAIVSIDVIPAYAGTRFSCLEEPFPLDNYQYAVTATDREGLLDGYRTAWRRDYFAWLQKKVEAILQSLDQVDLDVIVFGRNALPLELAAIVAAWSRDKGIHSVVGGYSVPEASTARSCYQSDLNINIDQLLNATENQDRNLVVDVVVRKDRSGSAVVSDAESPFSKRELLLSAPETIQLLTRDGWITSLLLPSKDSLTSSLENKFARPELVFLAAGIHINDLFGTVADREEFQGCPVVVCSSSLHYSPTAVILDKSSPLTWRQ